MNQTIQLLRDVVRNARTGRDAVEQLMKKTAEGGMKDELMRERRDYDDARQAGEQALRGAGGEEAPENPLSKVGMWAGLEMETLADRSDAHIAEIVIQGATMGVIEMTKALNTYDGADPGARNLASRFVVSQSEAIERQKQFLTN